MKDYDLLKVSTQRNFEQLQEILREDGSSFDKINCIEYLLERLVDVEMPQPGQLINPDESSLSFLQAVKRQLIYDKTTLSVGLWQRIPQESAILYRKLFPNPIGEEGERVAERWKEAYEACLDRGGPWKHHFCGEVFPMPPTFPPVCPKCDLRGWERVLEAYRAEKKDSYRALLSRIDEAKAIEDRTRELTGDHYERFEVSQEDAWPHACPSCGGPAYCGLNIVTCKAGCELASGNDSDSEA